MRSRYGCTVAAVVAGIILVGAIIVVSRNFSKSQPPPPPLPDAVSAPPSMVRLAEVRERLSRNDLAGARRALEEITAPDDEADRLRAELTARERRRDEALRVAVECQETDAFRCAKTNALEALTVDQGSIKASAILSTIERLGLVPEDATPRVSTEIARRACQRLVDDGRRALETERYDRAIDYANDALAMLALCPGADELKRDVTLARNAGPQGRGRP